MYKKQQFTIEISKEGKSVYKTATFDIFMKLFQKRLTIGKKMENIAGNKKVKVEYPGIKSLIKALNNAEFNTKSGVFYELVR